MRYVLFLLLFAIASAKVLEIKGTVRDAYNASLVNGSFIVLPKGDEERNVSGQIIDGKWQANVDVDEQKVSKILIVANTSSKIGFNQLLLKEGKSSCQQKTIRIKPFMLNNTPAQLFMEIEGVARNIAVNVNEENQITACLEAGEVYKINLIAEGGRGYFSFFYPVR